MQLADKHSFALALRTLQQTLLISQRQTELYRQRLTQSAVQNFLHLWQKNSLYSHFKAVMISEHEAIDQAGTIVPLAELFFLPEEVFSWELTQSLLQMNFHR